MTPQLIRILSSKMISNGIAGSSQHWHNQERKIYLKYKIVTKTKIILLGIDLFNKKQKFRFSVLVNSVQID